MSMFPLVVLSAVIVLDRQFQRCRVPDPRGRVQVHHRRRHQPRTVDRPFGCQRHVAAGGIGHGIGNRNRAGSAHDDVVVPRGRGDADTPCCSCYIHEDSDPDRQSSTRRQYPECGCCRCGLRGQRGHVDLQLRIVTAPGGDAGDGGQLGGSGHDVSRRAVAAVHNGPVGRDPDPSVRPGGDACPTLALRTPLSRTAKSCHTGAG